MKSFRLELRVTDQNTRRWQVFLERIREDHKVENWTPPSDGRNYFSKIWTTYTAEDDDLDVYLACTGYGGTAQCVVLIDDAVPAKKNTIIARFNDTRIASKSFPLT